MGHKLIRKRIIIYSHSVIASGCASDGEGLIPVRSLESVSISQHMRKNLAITTTRGMLIRFSPSEET